MTYGELQNALTMDAGILVFFKADGSKRVMLCTRNTAMASKFNGLLGYGLSARDGKMTNGKTMAVIDIMKGDIRAFTYDKLIHTEICGDLRDEEVFARAKERVAELEKMAQEGAFTISMEDL